MRLLARLVCALLALPAAFVHAEDFFVKSPATLALVASRTGPEQVKLSSGGARETFRAERQRFRISNKEVLELLAAEGLIPAFRGWRLVGIWSTWPGTGNGYRFHVQNTAVPSEIREVPQGILDLQVLGGAVTRRHRVSNESITGGTERYTMLAKLIVNDTASAGYLVGSLEGSGKYASSRVAGGMLYLPQSSRFTGAGARDEADPDSPDFILEGSLAFGAAKAVSTATPQTGSVSSSGASTVHNSAVNFDVVAVGVSASLQRVGSGSLTLGGGSLTFEGVVNPVLSHNPGGTLTLGAGSTLSFSPQDLAGFGTVMLNPGATFVLGDTHLLVGSPITLSGAGLAALDLANLPAGYALVDGVLTYTPPATVSPDPAP